MKTPLIKQGWLRALIFLLVWVMLQVGLTSILYKILEPFTKANGETEPTLNLLLISFLSLLGSVPPVLIFRKLVDRQSITSLGFQWKGKTNHAWTGFFSAIFIIAAGTLLLVVSGNINFIAVDFFWKDLMLYTLIMLLVAFAEELVVRGYILNNLLASFPKYVALLISATLFALFHFQNPDITWISMTGILIGGLLIGLNYIYTRNLWFGIFFHFAWNFFQGPLLGFKVSGIETDSLLTQTVNGPVWLTGGPFGFEASVTAIVFIAIVLAYLAVYYRKNQHAFVTNTAGQFYTEKESGL